MSGCSDGLEQLGAETNSHVFRAVWGRPHDGMHVCCVVQVKNQRDLDKEAEKVARSLLVTIAYSWL